MSASRLFPFLKFAGILQAGSSVLLQPLSIVIGMQTLVCHKRTRTAVSVNCLQMCSRFLSPARGLGKTRIRNFLGVIAATDGAVEIMMMAVVMRCAMGIYSGKLHQ